MGRVDDGYRAQCVRERRGFRFRVGLAVIEQILVDLVLDGVRVRQLYEDVVS